MPRKPKPPVPLEREVLKSCLAILKHEQIPHFRNNSGAIPLEDGTHKRRFLRAGAKDWPDVIGVIPWPGRWHGRALLVEVKRPGKRPTPGQYAVLRNALRAGSAAFWVTSAAELQQAIGRLKQGWDVRIDEDGECSLVPVD